MPTLRARWKTSQLYYKSQWVTLWADIIFILNSGPLSQTVLFRPFVIPQTHATQGGWRIRQSFPHPFSFSSPHLILNPVWSDWCGSQVDRATCSTQLNPHCAVIENTYSILDCVCTVQGRLSQMNMIAHSVSLKKECCLSCKPVGCVCFCFGSFSVHGVSHQVQNNARLVP